MKYLIFKIDSMEF